MSFLMQVANGIGFGTGLVIAASIMKILFHMSFC